jgi:signal transduction histidine kinase
MKLSAHYNKASIIITISVLLIGAVVYFFAINHIARNQLDRDLTEELEEVVQYVNLNQKLPKQVDFDEDQTVFIKTDQNKISGRFFDTIYVDPKEKKKEAGRAVEGLISLKGEHYRLIITESREGAEYLVQIIATITLALMIGLLLILFLTNRYVLKGLWKPFYDLLHQIKAFNISENSTFHLNNNKVDEFSELSQAMQIMSSRVKNDFQHLKNFTEDASHEMLTPLAVITAKLDTLIQDDTLKAEQFDQINDIYAAAGKLSRLNQSLLLLVKIENNMVEDADLLSLDTLIIEKIRQFQELMLAKNITINKDLAMKSVFVSKYLIDILLNNIFSNAIKHNIDHGQLNITLTTDKLIFQNTGIATPLNGETIFERFQKGNKSEGTGLGLTIVKNICNLYNWRISYYHDNLLHSFQITFPAHR